MFGLEGQRAPHKTAGGACVEILVKPHKDTNSPVTRECEFKLGRYFTPHFLPFAVSLLSAIPFPSL
jgi:hypothetical protein